MVDGGDDDNNEYGDIGDVYVMVQWLLVGMVIVMGMMNMVVVGMAMVLMMAMLW